MPDETWIADGHAAHLIVADMTLRLEIGCPHNPVLVNALPRESRPACWRNFDFLMTEPPKGQCGVIATALEFQDKELWADVGSFEITAAPFPVQWCDDPEDGVVLRPAPDAVTWLGDPESEVAR